MKKFKKNLSRTIFASFFIFQFVVSTSFMPLVANAEEVSVESEKPSKEEKKPEVVKEEKLNENVSEEIASEETKVEEDTSSATEDGDESSESADQNPADENEESLENTTTENEGDVSDDAVFVQEEVLFQEVGTNADLTVCKVLLNKEGEVVDGSSFSDAIFTIPFTFEGSEYSVTIEASEYESLKQTFGVDENQFDAMCKSVQVPVNLPITGLLPFSYGREEISGSSVWSDFYNEGDLQNGVLFNNGYPRFLPFGEDGSSDGEVPDLTGNLDTGLKATIFVVNKLISAGECDVPTVYARVNLEALKNSVVSKGNSGWYNTGNGNMAPKVFVGGTTDLPNEDGGDVYDIGEWFPIYDPATGYVNDPSLTSTDPGVNGLAVQRLDGQVRVVLYGSHSQPINNPVLNREMANGFIEFSNDQSSVSSDVVILNQVVDIINPLESNPNAPIDYPNNDYMSFTSKKSNFKFVVTTHNDGMYTVYTHSTLPENCGGEEENKAPIVSAPTKACILTTETADSYNPLIGVTAFDPEDGNLIPEASYGGARFGVSGGQFTVYYSATDSQGLVGGASALVVIKDNCDDEGDGIVESISVCKIIAKRVGNTLQVVPASEVPGYVFTIPWISAPTTPGTEGFNAQTLISEDAVFKTNEFTPNRKILADSTQDDAMCHTFSDLTLGSYFYGEETISGGDGSVVWDTKYSDQVLNPVDGFGDVYEYNDNLFTVGFDDGSIDSNGDSFNTNADGHIVLLQSRKVRTIVVLNIFEDAGVNTNTPPKVLVNPSVRCIQTDASSYNFFGGVTATDLEDDALGLTLPIDYMTDHPFVAGIEDEYLITYSVTDSGGLTATGTRTLYVKENCGGDGGDKEAPVIIFGTQACVAVGTANYNFMSFVTITDDKGVDQVDVSNNGISVVDFTLAGSYTISYKATDSDGNVTTADFNFIVSEDCDNGGGDDETFTLIADKIVCDSS